MIDHNTLFITIFSNLWPFFIFAFIVAFFKSPWMKGEVGEAIVNTSNKLLLDKDIYTPVKDITLQLADGSTTQIDHLLVSKYGVFVIETKNMKGWIFGGESQKQWTQQIFKEKNRFQNPLHQNYRHTKALEEILDLPSSHFTSVIAFVGECEFKTPMPENVFCGLSYTKYIKSFQTEYLSKSQQYNIINKLKTKRLKQGFSTDREHLNNFKQRKQNTTIFSHKTLCSRCSSEMIIRNNRTTGEKFYGCSSYPRCKNTKQIS